MGFAQFHGNRDVVDRLRVLMLDARRQPDVVHREIVDAVRQRFLGAAKSA